MNPRRLGAARLTLWLGAFMPIIYTVGRTVDEVGGVGVLEIVRGGGSLAALVVSYMIAPRPVRRLRAGLVEIGLIAFLLVSAASTLWSYDPRATALKMIPLIFAYWCCYRLVTVYASGRDVVSALVRSAHVILLGGLVQLAVIPSQIYSATEPGDIARFHTAIPAIASNLLGLVVGIAVAGIVLKVGPGWTYRGLWGPALIVLYAAILLAGRSRIVTVIAILLVGVAILAAMRRSHIAAGIGWLGAAGLLAALFVVLQLPGTQETIVQFALRDEDANSLRTLTGRTAIWDFALLAWQQSPWVGYGYYAGHRLALPTMFTIFSGYSNLDSTWIETLVNSGYLGTVPLAVFAAAGLVRVLRHPWGTPERWIAWGVAAATVGLSFINPGIQSTTSTMVLFAVVVAGSRQELSKQASVPTIIPAEVNAARGRAEGNSGQTELAT